MVYFALTRLMTTHIDKGPFSVAGFAFKIARPDAIHHGAEIE